MHRRPWLTLVPALLLAAAPVRAPAGVELGITVNPAPPPLPVYAQPPLPASGYLWVPGYWAWNPAVGDYYWVPGTWVLPPVAGYLWTPGYWAWGGGNYLWHPGYWGPRVGFYGGIDYGYGYTGTGFHGGYWHGGAFFYNRAVLNLGHAHVANAYSEPQLHGPGSRVSFNGGAGGLRARPTAEQGLALHDHHVLYTPLQHQHEVLAAGRPELRAGANGARPAFAATPRPGEFTRGRAPAVHAGAASHGHPGGHPERHPGRGPGRPDR